MNITSPDLSVLYEFQWLIGLFRHSISPLKQRHPHSGHSHGPRETRGRNTQAFFRLGKTSCGVCSVHTGLPPQLLPFVFQPEVVKQAESHDPPIITLAGPTYHPPNRASWKPGPSCLSAERWTQGFNMRSICRPRSPGQGWRERLGEPGRSEKRRTCRLDKTPRVLIIVKAQGWPWFCTNKALALHCCDIIKNSNSFYCCKGCRESVRYGLLFSFLECTLIRSGRGSKWYVKIQYC